MKRLMIGLGLPALALAMLMLGVLGGSQSTQALPGTGTLLGTDGSGGNLIAVDPDTGAGTLIGPGGVGALPSLAVDTETGTIYAGSGAGGGAIYTIDKATGAATFLGDTGLGFAAIGALDFRADGTLYAAVNIAGNGGTGSDHLATIDTSTGAATVVGPFGLCTGVVIPSTGGGSCTIEGMEAIAFDASGTLWGAHTVRGASGAAGLYTIDPSTGAATFVAPIDDGFGSPTGGVASLQFDCEGELYAGTATGIGGLADGGYLGTIDPATGSFTFEGSVSATGGSSLAALAYQQPCAITGKDPQFTNLWLCTEETVFSDNCNDADIDFFIDPTITTADPKCVGFPNFRPDAECDRQDVGAWEFEVRFDAKYIDVQLEAGYPLIPGTDVCQTYKGQGVVQIVCNTKRKDLPLTGISRLAVAHITPTSDTYSLLMANQDNGIVTQLINQDCNLSDTQGHPIPGHDWCANDGAVTIRYLEGDVHADCVIDIHDQQQIAFRWGSHLGQLLYNSRFDLEPSSPKLGDGDIDGKDIQTVFGRHDSDCKAPHPEQPPIDPMSKEGEPPLPLSPPAQP